jgi:FkbM family methyltransferase
MGLLSSLLKPEYVYRPGQIFRRLSRSGALPAEADVQTPWGLPMHIRPRDTVGHALWHLGVQDLILCEAVWRLADPGETCLDVGANIGVVTGLLARRVGPQGRVLAYEPHPDVHAEARANHERWPRSQIGTVDLRQQALSDQPGEAELFEPAVFAENRGTSSLEAVASDTGSSNANGRRFRVPLARLDEAVPNGGRVGLMKIDVEGHEVAVFRGAKDLLGSGRLRDIVFEEHHQYPSDASRALEAFGYRVFFLGRTFFGPLLEAPDQHAGAVGWLPPNFLATRDPERARARLAARGWQVLSAG